MNREEAQQLISRTLKDAFDKDRFAYFVRELVNSYESKPLRLYGAYIKDAYKEHVHGMERLGTYTDPEGEEVDILIVQLKRESALERARTMQRNFVADYLKHRGEKDAALVAYYAEGRTDWRFSFVKMDYRMQVDEATERVKIEEVLTPARRYSYLVGLNEPNHTAQRQIFPILQDDQSNPSLQQLEEAFSIEKVTQAFFDEYKALFLDLKEHIDIILRAKPALGTEFRRKQIDTANFAKKLLGQIVFLYFLQKKGWLGVQINADWGSGPYNFMRRLFDGGYKAYDNFFVELLEPLFYTALAIERDDNYYAALNCRIPFLNGGLFEPLGGYDWQQRQLTIPNQVFAEIFRVFDLYNFTVREDEPLEKDVAVDPEMLGKVFENLLEVNDRHSSGAYYTPREIVHYMCQESLIHYLDTVLNLRPVPADEEEPAQMGFLADAKPQKEPQMHYDPQVPKDDLAFFIRRGDLAIQHDSAKEAGTESYHYRLPESVRNHALEIDQTLAAIKVCDPAIGSGAFPVGMMQEIVRAREILSTYLPDANPEERTPYAFKRHAIHESLYGVDINPSAVDIAKLRLWLSLIVDEDDYRAIKPLPNLGYKIVEGNSMQRVEQTLFNNDLFARVEERKETYKATTDLSAKAEMQSEIDDLIGQITAGSNAFDFHVYFSEVFQQNNGFDVVIGNPPYVRHELISDLKPTLKRNYPNVYSGTADLYVYFYACGFSLLRSRGVLAYITSNKFMRASYGKKLREFLSSTHLQTIIDFGDAPVFDATTYPVILIIKKESSTHTDVRVMNWKVGDHISEFASALQDHAFELDPQTLSAQEWQLIAWNSSQLLQRLKESGTQLKKYSGVKIRNGIKTGLNPAFIIDLAKAKELIASDSSSNQILRPFLMGRDIKRWQIEYSDKYLIKIESSANVEHPWSGKPVTEAEKIFEQTYPGVYHFLMQYRERLENRADQGSYFWELRSCQFWDDFNQPKIIFPDIASQPEFTYDDTEHYLLEMTLFFITTKEKWLTGLLNSRLSFWFHSNISSTVRGGFLRFKKQYVEQFPIVVGSQNIQIAHCVQQILNVKESNPRADITSLETEIDELVYEMYGLTQKEIQLIEAEVQKLSRT